LPVTAVTTVSATHEDVHQRTGEQREPNQHAHHMGLMLGEQQRARDNQETYQNEPDTGAQGDTFMRGPVIAGMILRRHRAASALAKPA
jgi:hypothetical protein